MSSSERQPLHFIGSSLDDLRALPEEVQDVFGSALLDAQYGDRPEGAKPFGEGVPRQIMKLAEDHAGDTYRVAYSSSLPGAVYVLDAFRKKSKRGARTPEQDKNRIRVRWKAAIRHHEEHYGNP